MEIDLINTPCQHCVCAVYEQIDEVAEQIGCKLGRLDRFRAVDPDSVVPCENDQAKFFVINGRFCNYHRDSRSQWAQHYGADAVAQILDESKLKMSVVVVLADGEMDGLLKTVDSLLAQTLPPHDVFFLNNRTVTDTQKLHLDLYQYIQNKFTWRITDIFEKDADEERAIDIVAKNLQGSYFLAVGEGQELVPNHIESVHLALNDRLERFSVLVSTSDDYCGVAACQTKFFNALGGNEPLEVTEECPDDHTSCEVLHKKTLTNFLDKADYYAKTHNKPWLVKEVENV